MHAYFNSSNLIFVIKILVIIVISCTTRLDIDVVSLDTLNKNLVDTVVWTRVIAKIDA